MFGRLLWIMSLGFNARRGGILDGPIMERSLFTQIPFIHVRHAHKDIAIT